MKNRIDRRSFLRGTSGVALSLPLLECMALEARPGSPGDTPKRFLSVYMAHGFLINHPEWGWYPKVADGKMRFGKSMAAFNPYVDAATVLHGLEHPACVSVGGHCSADSFLTGSPHTASSKSPSLDQVAAAVHGRKTRYPSLVLGNEGGLGGSGSSKTLSYNQFGSPIPSSNDIRGLYDAMFNADPALKTGRKGKLAEDQRLVDSVLESYRQFRRRLGRDDLEKVDHYLHAVREVEKEVERLQDWVDTPKPRVSKDLLSLEASVKDPAAFIRTMYNLIYLAFQTDTTRYATYMLQSMTASAWDRIPRTLGLGSSHHGLAHDGKLPLGKYDKFQADLLAEFIEKLATTREGDGTMLDNTIVFYGCSNSITHVNRDYPLLLCGGKNLGLKHGRFVEMGDDAPPLSNLHVTLLNALDVPTESFSDSTGELTEIV